jgi:hypothetical protein
MIKHKKTFGLYHWDTFDNEIILIAEKTPWKKQRLTFRNNIKVALTRRMVQTK